MTTMKRTHLIFVGTMLTGFLCNGAVEPKWVSLFNGKDLTGWTVSTGAGQPVIASRPAAPAQITAESVY